jgi:hypothetical protein
VYDVSTRMGRGTREELDTLLECAWEGQRKRQKWAEAHLPASEVSALSVPEHNHPKIETGLVVAIISSAIGFIAILLQWNGVVEVKWVPSLIGYAVLVSVSMWALWRWEVAQDSHRHFRVVLFAFGSVLLISASANGVVTQYRREQPLRSVLTMSALATNVSYPQGTKFGGIVWEKSYGQLDLDITNPQEDAIQSIDVTVQVLDKGIIWNVGQLSDLSGVEFHPTGVPDVRARERGAAGNDFTVTFSDILALAGDKPFSDKWKIFCPRLSGDAALKLVLATSTDEKTGAQPTRLRIFGNYEHVSNEGTRAVPVDTTVAVDR